MNTGTRTCEQEGEVGREGGREGGTERERERARERERERWGLWGEEGYRAGNDVHMRYRKLQRRLKKRKMAGHSLTWFAVTKAWKSPVLSWAD